MVLPGRSGESLPFLRGGSYIRASTNRGTGPIPLSQGPRKLMPRKAIAHEEKYVVVDAPVTLTVVVGERQYGSSIVFLDDEMIANGDIRNLTLGRGPALVGRTATVYTLVTDIRSGTDEMSVTWSLSGGADYASATKSRAVAASFGSQMFKGIFHFTTAG